VIPKGNRIISIGDALSQLGNVSFLPRIHETTANESISGRAYRQDWKTLQKIINGIFFWQKDHCRMAFYNDLLRARAMTRKYKAEKL
tara:strand:- start:2040 stop:2300 length:261 start_codon:yes stop_codon:yes gene_type:complete